MIDLVTIIFALLMFCVIWFLIFKFYFIVSMKKQFKNIEQKLEKQNIKTDLIDEIKKQHAENTNHNPTLAVKGGSHSGDSKGDDKTRADVHGNPTLESQTAINTKKRKFKFPSFFKKKKKEVKEE